MCVCLCVCVCSLSLHDYSWGEGRWFVDKQKSTRDSVVSCGRNTFLHALERITAQFTDFMDPFARPISHSVFKGTQNKHPVDFHPRDCWDTPCSDCSFYYCHMYCWSKTRKRELQHHFKVICSSSASLSPCLLGFFCVVLPFFGPSAGASSTQRPADSWTMIWFLTSSLLSDGHYVCWNKHPEVLLLGMYVSVVVLGRARLMMSARPVSTIDIISVSVYLYIFPHLYVHS